MIKSNELDNPPVTGWHDAPTEPGLWLCNYLGKEWSAALFNGYEVTHFDRNEMKDCQWYGPIPQDVAIAKAEGEKL